MNNGFLKISLLALGFALAVLFVPNIVLAYPITGNAISTQEAQISAGLTPDSFFYFLDKALDNINLALTFRAEAKARKGLNIARERLLEVREMINANKLEAAQRAQKEHADVLNAVQDSVSAIESTNSSEEIEQEVEIENELEEHISEVEEVSDELEIKIKVRGNITSEQQALIDSILSFMQNKTGEVKIKIDNRKNQTKLRIKVETGKSEEEVDDEFEEIEEKHNLTEKRMEKAEEQIEDAEEEIDEVKEKLVEINDIEANITAVNPLISLAEEKLEQAKAAFNESKYGEAFGLARAAEALAKNAERLLLDKILYDGAFKIRAAILANETQVGIKLVFISSSNDSNAITQEILDKLQLSKEEIDALLKVVELDEVDIETRNEIKAEAITLSTIFGGSVSRIKTRLAFVLDVKNRSEIVDGIFNKLSALTAEEISNVLEIKIVPRLLGEHPKIEVRREKGRTKAEVEIEGVKARLELVGKNEDEIAAEIADRIGVAKSRIASLVKVIEEQEESSGKGSSSSSGISSGSGSSGEGED